MGARDNDTITAVPGLKLGHATKGATGCTVLLGPFRGAVDIRGLATGTREIETLAPTHLVPRVDAVLLTGGSAFGLAAADGVMKWVEEHGGGFDTGVAKVPIVPSAVIFDLTAHRSPPTADDGYAACSNASDAPVAEGKIGAGTGATISKFRGPQSAKPGGVGSYAMRVGKYTFGAVAVVNALGDVLDFNNNGVDSLNTLAQMANVDAPLTNTTITAIATDAPLSRTNLQLIARAGSSAIVRRIAPANTVFDGDVVFALSTAQDIHDFQPAELLVFSAAAQLCLEHAIVRAVK